MTGNSQSTEEELTCESCGEPRTPGSSLCPGCEDLRDARVSPGRPTPQPGHGRTPPHGNTTR